MQAQRAVAIQSMADLCSRVEPKRKAEKRVTCQPKSRSLDLKATTTDGPIAMKCHYLQCLFCIGDERLHFKDRTRIFSQQYPLSRHVEKHINTIKVNGGISCPHPMCKIKGTIVKSVEHLENYAHREHGIRLRFANWSWPNCLRHPCYAFDE